MHVAQVYSSSSLAHLAEAQGNRATLKIHHTVTQVAKKQSDAKSNSNAKQVFIFIFIEAFANYCHSFLRRLFLLTRSLSNASRNNTGNLSSVCKCLGHSLAVIIVRLIVLTLLGNLRACFLPTKLREIFCRGKRCFVAVILSPLLLG